MKTCLSASIALLAVVLAGCVQQQETRAAGPTPAEVADGVPVQDAVTWGGRIVRVSNLRDRTLVEVIGLPLNNDGTPQRLGQVQGRFIVERDGFLEPHEYKADRLLTVSGPLDGFREGKVGDASYRFPVVTGETLTLWPETGSTGSGGREPRVNVGVGVGSYGSGVGIGIGF